MGMEARRNYRRPLIANVDGFTFIEVNEFPDKFVYIPLLDKTTCKTRVRRSRKTLTRIIEAHEELVKKIRDESH
jgi:hypothetical protein